jgi:hypothetical protein
MGKPEAGCPNSEVGDGRGDPNGSPLLEMATVADIATKSGRAAGVAPTGIKCARNLRRMGRM